MFRTDNEGQIVPDEAWIIRPDQNYEFGRSDEGHNYPDRVRLLIRDSRVSRMHCSFAFHMVGGRYLARVQDLNSTNHTYVPRSKELRAGSGDIYDQFLLFQANPGVLTHEFTTMFDGGDFCDLGELLQRPSELGTGYIILRDESGYEVLVRMDAGGGSMRKGSRKITFQTTENRSSGIIDLDSDPGFALLRRGQRLTLQDNSGKVVSGDIIDGIITREGYAATMYGFGTTGNNPNARSMSELFEYIRAMRAIKPRVNPAPPQIEGE